MACIGSLHSARNCAGDDHGAASAVASNRVSNLQTLRQLFTLDDELLACLSERLATGTFASAVNRYCYFQTPKVACTAIKNVIFRLEHVASAEPNDRFVSSRETTRTMQLHQRRHCRMGSLLDLPETAFHDAITGAASWFSFGVCRNPFTRLLSFYRNKVCLNEPGYSGLHERFGILSTGGNERISFGLFVEELQRNQRPLRNAHLRRQADHLSVGLVPLTKVMRFEKLDADMRSFSSFIGEDVTLEHLNQTLFRDWPNPYSEETAERVMDIYRRDFQEFDYEQDSWMTDIATEPLSQARVRSDLAWITAICERNEMIDALYTAIEDEQR